MPPLLPSFLPSYYITSLGNSSEVGSSGVLSSLCPSFLFLRRSYALARKTRILVSDRSDKVQLPPSTASGYIYTVYYSFIIVLFLSSSLFFSSSFLSSMVLFGCWYCGT